MASIRAQRTLVKSPPELWEEFRNGDHAARWLAEALGTNGIDMREALNEPERALRWEHGGPGLERAETAVELERKGWGTRVTLSAELEMTGFFASRRERAAGKRMRATLERALDELGSAQRRPFSNATAE